MSDHDHDHDRLRPERQPRPRAAYLGAFAALVAITLLELGVAHAGVGRPARITALAGLAMAKVATLLLVFMHLRREARALKLIALLPLVLAPAFAVVLMLDTAFRVTGGR